MTKFGIILSVLISLCLVKQVQGYLTNSVQDHLNNLANQEISKQLVNGSDMKSANRSVQVQKSLMSMVQAGQILSYLNQQSSQNDKICKWLETSSSSETKDSVEIIFYQAEAQRLYKCKDSAYTKSVVESVTQVLSAPSKFNLETPNDFYQAFMINKRAKHYGYDKGGEGSEFFKSFSKVVGDKWLDGFSESSFALQGEEAGVTINSIKIVEMMASLVKDKALGEKLTVKVQKLMAKLFEQASSISLDDSSELQSFFVAPKNAYDAQVLELTQLNYHVLSCVQDAKRGIKFSAMGIDEEMLSLYRNYFDQKALGAVSLHQAFYSMKGLKSLGDQVFLQDVEGYEFVTFEGKKSELRYKIVDAFDKPVKVKSVKKATMKADGSNKTTDVSDNIKLLEDGTVIQVILPDVLTMPWKLHQIKFELGNGSYNTKTFLVKTQIYEQLQVSFSQTENWQSPPEYEVQDGYPVRFAPKNTGDFPLVHIQIDTEFLGDKEKQDDWPQTVFVTLKKEGGIPYSIHSDYIESIKRHQIDADLRFIIKEQINGDFQVTVHVQDSRASNEVTLKLGSLQVNFNEGSIDNSNLGVRDDYKMLDKITNYFPPEEPEKGALVPLVFAGLIVCHGLYFLLKLLENKANLSNMSFWGFLFTLNYAAILGVIVAFWVNCFNLVNCLWIMLALSPVTLFMMNQGLTPDNCHIAQYEKPGSSSGKKVKNN